MTKEQIVEVLKEEIFTIEDDGTEVIPDRHFTYAADRILAMSAPQWYYPEKGELPKPRERVYIHIADGSVLRARYTVDLLDIGLFEVNVKAFIPFEIIAWTPEVLPTPPQL